VDHSSQNVENEQRVSAQEKSLLQKNEDESKIADKPDWEAEKTTESRNERSLNGTETAFSLEDLFQMLSSQPENSLEVTGTLVFIFVGKCALIVNMFNLFNGMTQFMT